MSGELKKNEDILTGFSEIAQYLNVTVRTVIKWEARHKLPIMRPAGRGNTVYASRAEIEKWRRRDI